MREGKANGFTNPHPREVRPTGHVGMWWAVDPLRIGEGPLAFIDLLLPLQKL